MKHACILDISQCAQHLRAPTLKDLVSVPCFTKTSTLCPSEYGFALGAANHLQLKGVLALGV